MSSSPASAPSASLNTAARSDRWTLIAISALALVLSVGLHEHLGHTLACVVLGGHPTELGAAYVTCDYGGMPELSIRLVALAGPVVSLLIGVASFLVLRYRAPRAPNAYYFVWLLGTLGLMSATGYLLFSGVSGIGDFGTSPDGVIYQLAPEWLWRTGLTVTGAASYIAVALLSVRELDAHISGQGRARIRTARLLALTSYLTAAVVSIGIGLLNPHGFIIVAISSAASSLGAASGLLWMMQMLDRKREVPPPGLVIQRSWGWMALGVVVTLAYAVVFGPTLHP